MDICIKLSIAMEKCSLWKSCSCFCPLSLYSSCSCLLKRGCSMWGPCLQWYSFKFRAATDISTAWTASWQETRTAPGLRLPMPVFYCQIRLVIQRNESLWRQNQKGVSVQLGDLRRKLLEERRILTPLPCSLSYTY